jgi:putative ABC transport system permease protein
MIERLLHDLLLACRGLWRAKGFSLAAVATLGVGTAGATVILALWQGVLLRPLPVHDQRGIVVAWRSLPPSHDQHYPFGDREIEAVRSESRTLQDAAGVTSHAVSRWVVVDDAAASYVNGALVTGRFFDVLGVEPVLGRTLQADDDREGSERVLVISAGLWQRRYGGAPDVIGRRLTLDEQAFTIVGVMPRDLDYPRGAEAWRTTRSVPTSATFGDAARREVDLIGRLRPGVTVAQAEGELAAMLPRLEADAPANAPRGFSPVVRPFEEVVVGTARPALLALLLAVGIVLLIVSANVANLLLMRGEARRGELAIRSALGAGHWRIVRQLLMESAVLSALAMVVGLVVTWWSLQWLIATAPEGLPRMEAVRVDAVVVLFVAGVAVLTALVAGVVPALLSARMDIVSQLRMGARGVTGATSARGRRTLVTAQVALAVAVVAAAGLLTQTVAHLQSVSTGIASDRLVFVSLSLPQERYADRPRHARFLSEALETLQGIPRVEAVTPVNAQPFAGGWTVPVFAAEGQTQAQAASNPSLGLESVHHNYFEAMGVRIVEGRAFSQADRAGAEDVAIISEDVAARTWPNGGAIGQRIKMGAPASPDRWRTVVGVAAVTRYRDLAVPQATLYVPAAQLIDAAQTLAVRTTMPVDELASLLRARIKSIDADVQVMRIAAFDSIIRTPLARPRFNAFLFAIFGGVALFLAAIGSYAVLAASVRQREREIALRIALGATSRDVRNLVLRETLWSGVMGAGLGLGAATIATRVLRTMLFGVDPLDVRTLAAAAVLVVAATVLASWWPLRRATRVDALTMLRS